MVCGGDVRMDKHEVRSCFTITISGAIKPPAQEDHNDPDSVVYGFTNFVEELKKSGHTIDNAVLDYNRSL